MIKTSVQMLHTMSHGVLTYKCHIEMSHPTATHTRNTPMLYAISHTKAA